MAYLDIEPVERMGKQLKLYERQQSMGGDNVREVESLMVQRFSATKIAEKSRAIGGGSNGLLNVIIFDEPAFKILIIA